MIKEQTIYIYYNSSRVKRGISYAAGFSMAKAPKLPEPSMTHDLEEALLKAHQGMIWEAMPKRLETELMEVEETVKSKKRVVKLNANS